MILKLIEVPLQSRYWMSMSGSIVWKPCVVPNSYSWTAYYDEHGFNRTRLMQEPKMISRRLSVHNLENILHKHATKNEARSKILQTAKVDNKLSSLIVPTDLMILTKFRLFRCRLPFIPITSVRTMRSKMTFLLDQGWQLEVFRGFIGSHCTNPYHYLCKVNAKTRIIVRSIPRSMRAANFFGFDRLIPINHISETIRTGLFQIFLSDG